MCLPNAKFIVALAHLSELTLHSVNSGRFITFVTIWPLGRENVDLQRHLHISRRKKVPSPIYIKPGAISLLWMAAEPKYVIARRCALSCFALGGVYLCRSGELSAGMEKVLELIYLTWYLENCNRFLLRRYFSHTREIQLDWL